MDRYAVTFHEGDTDEGPPSRTETYASIDRMPKFSARLARSVEDLLVDPDRPPERWAFEVWEDELNGVGVEFRASGFRAPFT